MSNNKKFSDVIGIAAFIFSTILLIRFVIDFWSPIFNDMYLRITTGETRLEQSRDAVAEKKNPTIEDYIDAEYTFFLDGNKVQYPEKLNEDHYKIDTVDNDNYEIILERSDKISQ